ncbi:DUF6221 family protein [Actinomadura nitritigenes]|uniref:DUF6221 family protein n=1 Tax=Actinomadura nitritigenes TaxID=134602 RepID=UPI003D8B1C58
MGGDRRSSAEASLPPCPPRANRASRTVRWQGPGDTRRVCAPARGGGGDYGSPVAVSGEVRGRMDGLHPWYIAQLDADAQRVRSALAHPDRTLRIIRSLRAVAARHAPGPGRADGTRRCRACRAVSPCQELRLLASAYDDRHGYLEGWRPWGS